MFSWIASFFRPTPTSTVQDLEAAFETQSSPDRRSSSSWKIPAIPFAGRKVTLAVEFLTPKRAHLWWQDAKDFVWGDSQSLTVALSSRQQASRAVAPTPRRASPEVFQLEPIITELPARPPPAAIYPPLPRQAAPAPIRIDQIAIVSSTPKASTSVIYPPTPPRTPEQRLPSNPFFRIPDFITYSPYQLHVNPHYQPAALISEQWLHDHGVHESDRKRQAFEDCNFGLLTAMCYSQADFERFRVLCDFINALFAFDDLTDEGGLRKDAKGTRKASDIVMLALRRPFSSQTEFKCGRVFKDFWGRALETGVALGTQRRFLEATDLYVRAVTEQVDQRAKDTIPGIEEFIELRRDTGALRMCFAMGEFGLGIDIPDDVFESPLIKTMEDCANDVVVLSNDIYSYNIEQAQGDKFNIIEVAMKEKGLDVQGAIDFAGKLVQERVDLYTSCKAKLPSWGPRVDSDVQSYLLVCEDWMTGGFHWSLESKRYFGKDVRNVKDTLITEILPKQEPRGQQLIPDLDLAA